MLELVIYAEQAASKGADTHLSDRLIQHVSSPNPPTLLRVVLITQVMCQSSAVTRGSGLLPP